MAKQLYIPEFHADVYSGGNTIPWDVAANYFRNASFGKFYADGEGLLENLIGFEKFYDKKLAAISCGDSFNTWLESDYECEDDFFDDWKWEICAFNVLCEGFSKLFAPKEAA
jgi:hypothetical protein